MTDYSKPDEALLHYKSDSYYAGFTPTNMFRVYNGFLQQFMLFDKRAEDGMWVLVPVINNE
jgi:hypothetical protein